MVMLSELIGRTVNDGDGRSGRVADFAIDLSVPDYPPVTSMLVESREDHGMLPWSHVRHENGKFRVESLERTRQADDDGQDSAVFVRRDVMDALVLDVAGQRAVRVNDVWLEDDGDRLVVRGIDASPWAILRRLGRGWLGRSNGTHVLDAREVVYLRGDPRQARRQGDEHQALAGLRPAEIAGLADALPYLHAAELIVLLPTRQAANVFKRLSPERRVQVLGELSDDQRTAVLGEMSPDHVADVLASVQPAEARRLIELLPEDRAALVTELLRYPADTAGGIMTNDLAVVRTGVTIADAIEAIRPSLARPNPPYMVYVVDDEGRGRLQGILSFRDLLVADRDQMVKDVMTPDVVAADPMERAADVAYRLADHDFKALPVVGPEDKLIGVITLDAAIAQIAPATIQRDLPKVFA